MAARNRYIFRSKISEAQFREILWLSYADLAATQIAQVSGLNRNTVNRIIRGIRERIALACKEKSPFSGELNENHFGARRVHGARGKTIVFGIINKAMKGESVYR